MTKGKCLFVKLSKVQNNRGTVEMDSKWRGNSKIEYTLCIEISKGGSILIEE